MLDEDCEVLDLDPVGGRPEKMILEVPSRTSAQAVPQHVAPWLQSILVPPVCIRPNVPTGPGRMNEDDLTVRACDPLVRAPDLSSSRGRGTLTPFPFPLPR